MFSCPSVGCRKVYGRAAWLEKHLRKAHGFVWPPLSTSTGRAARSTTKETPIGRRAKRPRPNASRVHHESETPSQQAKRNQAPAKRKKQYSLVASANVDCNRPRLSSPAISVIDLRTPSPSPAPSLSPSDSSSSCASTLSGTLPEVRTTQTSPTWVCDNQPHLVKPASLGRVDQDFAAQLSDDTESDYSDDDKCEGQRSDGDVRKSSEWLPEGDVDELDLMDIEEDDAIDPSGHIAPSEGDNAEHPFDRLIRTAGDFDRDTPMSTHDTPPLPATRVQTETHDPTTPPAKTARLVPASSNFTALSDTYTLVESTDQQRPAFGSIEKTLTPRDHIARLLRCVADLVEASDKPVADNIQKFMEGGLQSPCPSGIFRGI